MYTSLLLFLEKKSAVYQEKMQHVNVFRPSFLAKKEPQISEQPIVKKGTLFARQLKHVDIVKIK